MSLTQGVSGDRATEKLGLLGTAGSYKPQAIESLSSELKARACCVPACPYYKIVGKGVRVLWGGGHSL